MDLLLRLSYIVFIFGLLMLFILYYFYTPDLYTIQDLNSADITDFSFQGKVIEHSVSEGLLFLKIESSCSVNGVFFVDSSDLYDNLENSSVLVSGHIDEYEGKRQYIFDELKVYGN